MFQHGISVGLSSLYLKNIGVWWCFCNIWVIFSTIHNLSGHTLVRLLFALSHSNNITTFQQHPQQQILLLLYAVSLSSLSLLSVYVYVPLCEFVCERETEKQKDRERDMHKLLFHSPYMDLIWETFIFGSLATNFGVQCRWNPGYLKVRLSKAGFLILD